MLMALSSVKDFAIEAADGRLGTVSDFLFDDRTWQLRWMVVDTGGWLSGRKVLIQPSAIGPVDQAGENLAVHLTKQQVKDSPDIMDDETVSLALQDNLYGYYGWDPLWGGGGYFGFGGYPYGFPAAPVRPPIRPRDEGTVLEANRNLSRVDARLDGADPHLRSASAVTGYHIRATDGSIGHIENFMVETEDWGIRYLVLDTRNWWPGKRVLLSPYAVKTISWIDREIVVDVSRDQVKASPPWRPEDLIDQAYEERLHGYYGWRGYGW